MMEWIYNNIELCGGVFCGFFLAVLFFIVTQMLIWRQNHCTVLVVGETTSNTPIGQCLRCHKEFVVTEDVRFCPICGREIERVIDK